MQRNMQLLIIDPQNDFCDLPAAWLPLDPLTQEPSVPALPVAGAHADMLRIAGLIEALQTDLTAVVMTLDSHQRVDIAHPTFWLQGDGQAVGPFTTITAAQVRAGRYRPRDLASLERVLAYLDELEARGRYTLMVWPVHCEIGTWGANVHSAVQAAAQRWAQAKQQFVKYVYKGTNPWTEHYSAIQAEVPDAADDTTQLNHVLLTQLDAAEVLLVAGEASSHCVRATVEHLVDNLPSGQLAKVRLLTDCMSPVSGFEAQAEQFLAAMRARGVQLTTVAQAQVALSSQV